MMLGEDNLSQAHEPCRLAPAQLTAIRFAEILSEKIITQHPEVADDYRAGLDRGKIVLKYNLHKDTTIRVAREAVRLALKILIPDENERIIYRERIMLVARQQSGERSLRDKMGIHSLSQEERIKNSSKSGKMTREQKTGIFGMTAEQKKQATRNRIVAKGEIPWIVNLVDAETGLNEIDYLFFLARQPEFIHQKGSGKGFPDRKKIAEKLNEIFHNGQAVRTPIAIMSYLSKLRKEKRLPQVH